MRTHHGPGIAPGGLSRRRFLRGAVAAGALAAGAPALGGTPAFASAASPYRGLPSPEAVRGWQQQLVGFGTRYTGSRGHSAYTDWLTEQFRAIPGFTVRTDRHTFHRWLARGYSLSVEQPAAAGRSGPVPVSYYYPYSGRTPAGGVTGRLVDLGTYLPAAPGTSGTGYTPAFWAPAAGAIALVRTPVPAFPLATAQRATGGYEPGKTSDQAAADYRSATALSTNPAWQGILAPVPLLDARNAGVRGVVCVWTGLPDDEVANQYNPFTTPYPSATGLATPDDTGCPALWVGDATGTSLALAAATGLATATLELTADITVGAATETVWGTLKGSGTTGESIIANTHTDGPNAVEENGGLALLALTRYLAAQPSRNRDLHVALVTGHFQLPQFTAPVPDARLEVGSDATSVWLADHPDLAATGVVGVTLEHLGCTAWAHEPLTHQYTATGGNDWSATYTARRTASTGLTDTEQQTYLAAVEAVNAEGWTDAPVATVLPGVLPLYLGEGAPLYAAGLGTVSLCPAPTYLLQAGDPRHAHLLDLDKLDPGLMYGQILAFARTLRALDAVPALDL